MSVKLRLLSVVLSLALSACTVYRIDIQQGNEITESMLADLELSMNRDDIVEVLGRPLVNDPFHTDRWDYYFYLKDGASGEEEQHSATLHFDRDGALKRIQSTLLDEDIVQEYIH